MAVAAALLLSAGSAFAFSAAQVDDDVKAALQQLYDTTPAARDMGREAKGILVFPDVVKAGFVLGAQHGIGALLQEGETKGYYETDAASYGLQAGVQKFSYALFLMSDSAMENLNTSNGWEVGSSPSLVIADQGIASSFTTTTARHDVYAFFFGQKGLMLGLGLQGSKITRVEPDR
jgi:lipid-binding SYLF domain-containing protein